MKESPQDEAPVPGMRELVLAGKPIVNESSEPAAVDADDIRSLLIDAEIIAHGNPFGLAMAGITIVGPVNLEGVTFPFSVRFVGCQFLGPIDLRRATLDTFVLERCAIDGMDLYGVSLTAAGLSVRGALTLSQTKTIGTVRLNECQIGGGLSVSHGILGAVAPGFMALEISRSRVGGDLVLEELNTTGPINLVGSVINGQLRAHGAQLMGHVIDGYSLIMDGAKFTAGLSLGLAPSGLAFHSAGGIKMQKSTVGGQISMAGAHIGTHGGQALVADGLVHDGDVVLDGVVTHGIVSFTGASIDGQLRFNGSELRPGTDTPALILDRADVRGMCSLLQARINGVVSVINAKFHGSVYLNGASISARHESGNSIVAIVASVSGGLYLVDGFVAVGDIDLSDATLRELATDDLESRRLNLSGSSIDTWRIFGRPPRLKSAIGWQIGSIESGRISGPNSPGVPVSEPRLAIRSDPKAARDWIATESSPQPLVELADLFERHGDYDGARRLRYYAAHSTPASKDLPRRSRLARIPGQIWHWFYGAAVGHGFYPFRSIAWLIGIFVISAGIATISANGFTTHVTPAIATVATTDDAVTVPLEEGWSIRNEHCSPGWPINCFQPITFAIATAIPAASITTPWSPPENMAIKLTLYGLRAAGWFFTALFIAGVTGLLRRRT